ncbi:MAG: energy transducer TonB [Bacteroidota bacterium]
MRYPKRERKHWNIMLSCRKYHLTLLIWGVVGGLVGVQAQDLESGWYDPEAYRGDSIPAWEAFVSVDKEPEVLNFQEAWSEWVYPPELLYTTLGGTTVFRMLVNEKGDCIRYAVIREVHPLLTKALETCIHQLEFSPAIQYGQPISYWINLPITICLR